MEWAPIWIASIIAAASIGSRKGETGLGILVGMIFGPLGILFAILSTGNRIKCPSCVELIQKDAKLCPHRRSTIPQA